MCVPVFACVPYSTGTTSAFSDLSLHGLLSYPTHGASCCLPILVVRSEFILFYTICSEPLDQHDAQSHFWERTMSEYAQVICVPAPKTPREASGFLEFATRAMHVFLLTQVAVTYPSLKNRPSPMYLCRPIREKLSQALPWVDWVVSCFPYSLELWMFKVHVLRLKEESWQVL